MIPLLTRIDNALAQCADPAQRAELLAERACYLARVGEFVQVRQMLSTLRQAFGNGRNIRISIWMMLIEGLVLYFEKLSSSARDRIYRASVICDAAGIVDLRCTISAWLAHLEFERSAYESMGELISSALSLAKPKSHDVYSRVGIVLGDAFSYVGDQRQSRIWYECARVNAVHAGDQATLGALMYNRPAFTLARLRVEHYAFGQNVNAELLDFARLELSSALSFQIGTKVSALSHVGDLCQARIEMLLGSFGAAVETLRSLQLRIQQSEDRPNRSSIVADLIFCYYSLDRFGEAINLVSTIADGDFDCLDVDDRLVSASILSNIAHKLGLREISAEIDSKIDAFRMSYRHEISRLSSVLTSNRFCIPDFDS